MESIGWTRACAPGDWTHSKKRRCSRRQRRGSAKRAWDYRPRGDCDIKTRPARLPGDDPQIKIIATTLREVHSTNRHGWGGVAWINGQTCMSPQCELDVYDRIGGGDGFASGFFYGILAGESPEQAMKLGWAHGALLTTFPGDTTMATLDQVRSFAQGGTARVQR